MNPFADLTAAGQARRLRALAQAALSQYELPVTRLRLLTYHFNAIFRVDTRDGRKFVLRINIPGVRSIGQIRSEAQWLSALRSDTDLVVPEPVLNRGGELVTTASAPGVPEARHCVVFGWVAGRDLRHAINAENYRKLGEFTSRLHDHAETWSPPADFDLKLHDGIFLMGTENMFWDAVSINLRRRHDAYSTRSMVQ